MACVGGAALSVAEDVRVWVESSVQLAEAGATQRASKMAVITTITAIRVVSFGYSSFTVLWWCQCGDCWYLPKMEVVGGRVWGVQGTGAFNVRIVRGPAKSKVISRWLLPCEYWSFRCTTPNLTLSLSLSCNLSNNHVTDYVLEATDMPDELVRKVNGIKIFEQTSPQVGETSLTA